MSGNYLKQSLFNDVFCQSKRNGPGGMI